MAATPLWVRNDDCGTVSRKTVPLRGHPLTTFLINVVDDLRARGIWDDIRINEQGYTEWMSILSDDGLIDAPIPYTDLVDPHPAQEAVLAASGQDVADDSASGTATERQP
ncbi:hypothetical protein ACTXLV_16530 [Brachybacterium alimentarium]|uniref:hypothetical protein n=1 Tax=Brachybacterium alimentarium TaxID=47845 RepID=UPI003FD4ADAA